MGINLLATRIDNRLVHGQVGMTWANSIGANLVVVANDEVSSDDVQKSLMEMVLSEGIGIRFFTLQKTIDIIHKASPKQKIFLVVRTPQDVLTLVEGGVPIKEVNIGNLHFSDGKKQIHPVISVDSSDVEAFKKLSEHGVKLEIRGVPTDKSVDLMSIL